MKYSVYFSYLFTASMVALASFFKSAPFAYAAVLGLVITLGKESLDQYAALRASKGSTQEELKKIRDLEARVTSIEVGIQRRGF